MDANASRIDSPMSLGLLGVRGVIGGIFMGLANLVPGISGGTMLLAAGVYPRFINAIGEVTTLKFRRPSLVILLSVVIAAVVAIAALAGPVKDMVVDHRWVMYSLFIGLTLGGVPVLWRLIGQHDKRVWIAAAAGFAVMVLLAFVQHQDSGAADRQGPALMFVAGIAGASAMILPGVSGGYLLLVLGVYVPILAAISSFKGALPIVGELDWAMLWQTGVDVIMPVGVGVVIGVVLVSNLLRWLLRRYERVTLGVLLGLLLGAVVGLWPFQQGIAPAAGDIVKGQQIVLQGDQLIYEKTGKTVEPDDYPAMFFRPGVADVGGAIGLIIVGFGVTLLVDRVGRERKPEVTA
jgi:putative membrane protein